MHEMMCIAGHNLSRKMDGEACPAIGSGKARVCSDHGRMGRAVELPFQALFCSTLTFKIWRKSCTKASFSHLQLSEFDDFDGSLARRLCFHIFNCRNLEEVLHESFVFTSSTFTFEGDLARKLRFHIFNCPIGF